MFHDIIYLRKYGKQKVAENHCFEQPHEEKLYPYFSSEKDQALQLREYWKDLEYRRHHCLSKYIPNFEKSQYGFFLSRNYWSLLDHDLMTKGQLISKCPYEKSVSSKITMKKFPRFLPQPLRRGQIKNFIKPIMLNGPQLV